MSISARLFACLFLAHLFLVTTSTIEEDVLSAVQEAFAEFNKFTRATTSYNRKAQPAIPEAAALGRRGELIGRATRILVQRHGVEILMNASEVTLEPVIKQVAGADAGKLFFKTSSCLTSVQCNTNARFRSFSGDCNNLINIKNGAALTPHQRLLPSEYDDDYGSIRTRAANGSLPSARHISNSLFIQKPNGEDLRFNHLVMQFGQFLAHDLISTPSVAGESDLPLKCECGTTNFDACAPIEIPADDTYFSGMPCIGITRALNGQTSFGERVPINQVSHYLDLSTVYGSDDCTHRKLRTNVHGKLKEYRSQGYTMMPQDKKHPLCQSEQSDPCFLAGDDRNSIQPALAGLHTLFIKYHNFLAGEIQVRRPELEDEEIFQVTRRILTALYQHFIYTEWLPLIIGPSNIQRFSIDSFNFAPFSIYNQSINPGITSEFGAAALRMGHSLIRQDFRRLSNTVNQSGSTINLGENVFYANAIYDKSAFHYESLAMGQMHSPLMKFDNQFADDVRNRIFEERGLKGSGIDLVATNIQRARDLGIPPYTKYRQLRGLPTSSFEDLASKITAEKIELLKTVYADVNDIDLYAGIVMENAVFDGIVGPTAAFIIGTQFDRLRKGDRFFYTHANQAGSFSREQLVAIHDFDMRNIFCTGTNIPTVPRNLLRFSDIVEFCDDVQPLPLDVFLKELLRIK